MKLYRRKKIFEHRIARFCSVALSCCLLAASITGCGSGNSMEGVSESLADAGGDSSVAGGAAGEGQGAYTIAGDLIAASEMFTERDLSGEYDAAEAEEITLSGENVTITKEGIYLLRGTLKDGIIIVDADKNDKVQLVLDGMEIDNDANAAIYVKKADKVFVTLAEGSENSLTSRGYTSLDGNNIDGVIYAKSDLVINGTGSLTVNAVEGHGIVSRDDLKVTGGAVTVTAEKQGLSGKDSVRVGGGALQITAGKDGIHAENNDDTEKGYVYIADGTIQIISDGDGISAGSVIQVDGGTVDIIAGGGSNNRTVTVDENGDTVSTKGIKAAGGLAINQVTLFIDSQDDAIHSDLNVVINGGDLSLATGNDGIHADETTSVTGGNINISDSYEGIEGNNVEISGGMIRLYAIDDGLNAAGGNDQSGFGGMFGGDEQFGNKENWGTGNGGNGGWESGNGGNGNRESGNGGRRPGNDGSGNREPGNGDWEPGNNGSGNREPGNGGIGGQEPGNGGNGSMGNAENENGKVSVESDVPHIWISGGVVCVRADGDGLDSNGDLLISGGEVYVSGPENSANGAIDYERNGQITGGIVVAAGSSGMAMNFGNASTQGSILITTANCPAGTVIAVQDSEGKELLSYTAECTFNSIVVSSPELVLGGTYVVTAGEESTEVTLSDSLIYGSGFGMGGFGNGGRMPGGQMPDGEQPQMPEGGMPDGERPRF